MHSVPWRHRSSAGDLGAAQPGILRRHALGAAVHRDARRPRKARGRLDPFDRRRAASPREGAARRRIGARHTAFHPIASLCGMPVTIEGQGTLLRRPMHMMIDPLRRLGVRVRTTTVTCPSKCAARSGAGRSTSTARFRRSSSRGCCWRSRSRSTTPRSTSAAPSRPLSGHDRRHGGTFRRGNLP